MMPVKTPGTFGMDTHGNKQFPANVYAGDDAGFVEIAPTWSQSVPLIVAGLRDADMIGREIALKELRRMAELLDRLNNALPDINCLMHESKAVVDCAGMRGLSELARAVEKMESHGC